MSGIASLFSLYPDSNYSVLALPIYYILCIVPHSHAIYLASGGKVVSRWDNRNPRTDELRATLKQRLDAATYAAYQRSEAAHYNSLESFPVLAAAVILGNIARLPNADLNNYVVTASLLRALYIIVYISTARQRFTFLRSFVWFGQLGVSLSFIWKAGKALL